MKNRIVPNIERLVLAWLVWHTARPKRRRRTRPAKTPSAPKKIREAEAALDRAADQAVTEEMRMREQIAKTVREIMEENGLSAYDGDAELKRVVSTFLLLREQGYSLSVTPAEKATAFEKNNGLRRAA